MTQVTAAPETPAKPAAVALPAHPFEPCDAHAEPTTQAVFEIVLPSGGTLHMCGHHAYTKFGIDEKTWLHGEDKQKGSDH